MLRRRPALRRVEVLRRRYPAQPTETPPVVDERDRLDELRADGWVLPNALASGRIPAWTLVGTVDSPWATAVDPCGLVTPFGPGLQWSLDWWIGADDRWHVPSADTGVRQQLIGHAPVVETLVRIPGGDAVQRVYGVRGEAFSGGDEWVVVEVENRSSVPFAIAFAVRPFTPEGLTSVSSIGMGPVGGGQGRDSAHAITVDGRPAVVFSRRPARLAASSANTGDVAAMVLEGDVSESPRADAWSGPTCEEGLANAAFVFPVAHTTSIRLVLPIGAEPNADARWPAVIPAAAHVVAGWDAHAGRATRVDIPSPQLAAAEAAARRALLLAPWSDGLRYAGPPRGWKAATNKLADTGRIVATLDRLGYHAEATRTLQRWPDILATSGHSPEADAAIVDAVATHRLLAGDQPLFDDLLPDIVASVSRMDRAAKRGHLDPVARRAAVRGLTKLARALAASGQAEGAADVTAVATRVSRALDRPPATRAGQPRAALDAAIDGVTAAQLSGLERLDEALAAASPTFGFASPGEPQDLVAAGLLLDVVCALLVRDTPAGLDLLTVFPPQWYGGPVELHDAPTSHGRISYAVRWHGMRPALLWELDRENVGHDVRIAAPGLDAEWSTTEARGEALLAEVPPPVGVQPLRIVAEHPGEGGTFA